MKTKRRLRLQILALVMVFYIIGMSVSTISMYYSSRNSFLKAKEDMIERDLSYVSKMLSYPEIMSWFFDFSKKHIQEIKAINSFDHNITIFNIDEKSRKENIPATDIINSLSDSDKIILAASVYDHIRMQLDSQSDIFKYGGMICFDIRDSDRGFVYYEAAKDAYDQNSQLGDRCDINIVDHSAMSLVLRGNLSKTPFEIAPAEWDDVSDAYIGYTPLIYNGEVKAVIAITYNWDDFHSTLMNQIWLMAGLMLAGMLLCGLLMLILVNRIAIKPLSNVQKTVRQYMNDKDSDAAQELLKKIKTRNEIGVLADDVGALTKEITQYTEHIKTLTTEVMEALAQTIDAKDKYTNGHSFRVAMYSMMIAKEIGLSKQQQIDVYYMGLLHDIGKIGIPNAIINKTSKLTDEEYDKIKQHPVYGYEILSQIQSMPDLSIGARYHHERIDGKGYPDHLTGDQIPFSAKIIAVADSYDTMTSNRSYRKYLPQEVARSEIENNIGTQFDEVPARAMLKLIDADKLYMLHE